MAKQRHAEGMKIARLLMVLSSISPLFILWGIRGNNLIPDIYFSSFCTVMVIVPNFFLWLRVRTVRKLNEKRELVVGTAEDHREHLLVYLFAMLLPFYAADLGTYRDIAAAIAALCFIVFLFWHLNLHYMNLLFAVFGYRVFTINPPADDNPLSGKFSQVLITRRTLVLPGERLVVYSLSDTVTMEVNE
ncbi:MAG: hypothetical protein AEth_01592 [Candidatus Argoarchaeum ethanivorans]|uniref:Uncharacterized protein n=1 Tax=Candidatus Argoarchaeum ethanivorans TaxID=2608793 RepID=A0A8B3S0Z6_9EURY|nr:MAG: hypothetical protein AEth_01592 [Candidatus Argoarchaeum ethanivorans]